MILRVLFALLMPVMLMAQAPVITFDKVHHSFGQITPDRKVAAKFKVTNTGNAFLSITQTQPSCGCTATMLGQWSIGPGDSTSLEVTFDPRGMKGPVRKSVLVVSNDPKSPSVTLTMEAEVVQEIMPSQDAVYLEAGRTVPLHAVVRYSSGSGEPVQIIDAKAPGAPYLSFTFRQEGKEAVLDVHFDGRKVPQGATRNVERATVRFTNPRMPQLPLDIQWALKAAITATPASLVFEEAAGKELKVRLVLKHADGKAFRVSGMTCSLPQIRVEGLLQKSAPQQELTVSLPASLKAGRYSETLSLTTDDPDQPELTLRLNAILN